MCECCCGEGALRRRVRDLMVENVRLEEELETQREKDKTKGLYRVIGEMQEDLWEKEEEIKKLKKERGSLPYSQRSEVERLRNTLRKIEWKVRLLDPFSPKDVEYILRDIKEEAMNAVRGR